MENKDNDNNTDGNINPSSAATWAVTSLGKQINTATDHQASSGSLSDIEFDYDENFDLLEMFCDQDFNFGTTSTIFDVIGEPSSVMLPQALQPDQPELLVPAPALGLNPEVNVNTPDDFSMIYSSSNETVTQDQVIKQVGKYREEEKVNDRKKFLKPNSMSTKKPELPRSVFVTKSEIDVMDDGYKWRKYGRKALKKSTCARHYYRCTGEACGVVKRVERSLEDPSTVVTTYVGNHNHIRPVIAPRGSKGMSSKRYGFPGSSSSGFGGGASLGGGIGGNFSDGISGGRLSCGMDGSMNGASGGMGGASGGIVGSSGGGGFTYGLGGSNLISSGIGGASGDGGDSFSIAIGSSGMIIDNAVLNGFGGSCISAAASDTNLLNYTIEQQDSYQQHWQQHQRQPYLHNTPRLSSNAFGAANVLVSAAAATQGAAATQAAAAPTTTTTSSGSSAAMGSGILSFENNGFYAMEKYGELGMLRDGELLPDMLTSQMQPPKERGGEY